MAKAKAKTKAKAKAQAQIPEGGQFARCVEINEYEDKKGRDKEIYTMILDDVETQTFSLFERNDFKLELNTCCVPVVAVIPSAYIDKNGRPRAQNAPVVNWVIDPERSADSDGDPDGTEVEP